MVQRREIVLGLAALPLVSLLPAALAQEVMAVGDTIPTAGGDISVYPIEHASLVLVFGDQVIYADPVGGAALYEGLPPPTGILVTHGHGDHFDVPTLEAIAGSAPIITSKEVFDKLPEALKANATALANGESGSLNGIAIAAVAAYNVTADRLQYHPKGVGNGYLITLGDKVVYVAGDTEPTPEMLALTGIAAAFLPMNLPYTMTPEQAAEAINTFKPAIVYPYHYGESDLSGLEAEIDDTTDVRLLDWYPTGS